MGRYSKEIAPDVAVVTTAVSNCYLVGTEQSWVLVDALTPGNEGRIVQAAEERFGVGACPDAIVLTHGHFDHAGSAPVLAKRWNVRVHAHRLEFPYLTGLSAYPPMDPTTPGSSLLCHASFRRERLTWATIYCLWILRIRLGICMGGSAMKRRGTRRDIYPSTEAATACCWPEMR